MRVAVLCEFSGVVRDAFRARGHDAISCDLLPCERGGPHVRGDCLAHDRSGYDLVVAHPPCTFLTASGARRFAGREREQEDAVAFVRALLDLPVPRLALENPVGVLSSRVGKPDQVIHPWQHGHPDKKATCLWLLGLPPLRPTRLVTPAAVSSVLKYSGGHIGRNLARSRTYPGIAAAMAQQWGDLQPDSEF